MGFAIGSKVRVVKETRDYALWVPKMDNLVNDGCEYVIKDYDSEDRDYLVAHGSDSTWFPAEALEAADKPSRNSTELLKGIKVCGYHWNDNTYSNKNTLVRAITKDAYTRYTKSNGDAVAIQTLIDELKEIKEACLKLN